MSHSDYAFPRERPSKTIELHDAYISPVLDFVLALLW